ncbi:MAG: hypothetical protein M1839_002524 [Geoglossum umbratile]|nr:MAG: hypothetical protein M1839_002524 [Geoglossum umbratile]
MEKIVEWFDYRQQAHENCELLCRSQRKFIITRQCDGGYQALAVGFTAYPWGPVPKDAVGEIFCQSATKERVEDAIKDLHYQTAALIGQRYGIVDGRMSIQPVQPARRAEGEGNWQLVQQTPIESEGNRGLESNEVNTKASEAEGAFSTAAGETSFEVLALPDVLLSRDEDTSVEANDQCVESKGEQISTGGRMEAMSANHCEDEWNVLLAGKKKKARKAKSKQEAIPPPPPPPSPPPPPPHFPDTATEDQLGFGDVQLSDDPKIELSLNLGDSAETKPSKSGFGTWGSSWGTGKWDFGSATTPSVDMTEAKVDGNGDTWNLGTGKKNKKKNKKDAKKDAFIVEEEVPAEEVKPTQAEEKPVGAHSALREPGSPSSAVAEDDEWGIWGKKEGRSITEGKGYTPQEKDSGGQAAGTEPAAAEKSSWDDGRGTTSSKKNGRITEENSVPVAETQKLALEPEPEPATAEESSWPTCSSKKDKKRKKKGLVADNPTPMAEPQDSILEPELAATEEVGWPTWEATSSKKDKKRKKKGLVADDPTPMVEPQDSILEPELAATEEIGWPTWEATSSKKDKKRKKKGLVADSILEPEPAATEEIGWAWATTSKKDKGNNKNAVAEAAENDWSSWGSIGKRNTSKTATEADEDTPTNTQPDATVESKVDVMEESWAPCGITSKKDKKKGKKKAMETAPTITDEVDVWSFWGTSKKTKKNVGFPVADTPPVGVNLTEECLIGAETCLVKVEPFPVEAEACIAEVETFPVEAETFPAEAETLAVGVEATLLAKRASTAKDVFFSVNKGAISDKEPPIPKAEAPPTEETLLAEESPSAVTPSPANGPLPPSNITLTALIRIHNTPSSLFTTLLSPLTRTSIIQHAAKYIAKSESERLLFEEKGKVQSVIFGDGAEVGIEVDDEGLRRIWALLGAVPTLVVDLGIPKGGRGGSV